MSQHHLRRVGSRLIRLVGIELKQYSNHERIVDELHHGRMYYSNLPEDIAKAARQARFPAKKMTDRVGYKDSGGIAEATSTMQVEDAATAGAKVATTWMFPWERRQLQGGALSTWEKLYWGVFVVAISVFLFNRAGHFTNSTKEDDDERDRVMEEQKKNRARLVLSGASMIEEEDDPFEGLTPEEIQVFVENATGANVKDPFEGMSPEEINAYVAANNMKSV